MKNRLKLCAALLCAVFIAACSSPKVIHSGASVETCFSYTHTCGSMVTRLIQRAKKRILLAGYGFTSSQIAQAIKEAHARGVKVHLVLDASNETAKYSRAPFLANAGVDIKINHRYAIMHHKFIIVDGAVGFGSMNFTQGGDVKNAENFNIFRQEPKLVKVYEKEFSRLYKESETYRPRVSHEKRARRKSW